MFQSLGNRLADEYANDGAALHGDFAAFRCWWRGYADQAEAVEQVKHFWVMAVELRDNLPRVVALRAKRNAIRGRQKAEETARPFSQAGTPEAETEWVPATQVALPRCPASFRGAA